MCSPDIVFFIFRMVEWYCLVTGAQHDVIKRAPRSHADNALANLVHPTRGHGMRALQTLGRGSGGNAARVMERCRLCHKPTPLGELDANLLQVDHDGDDDQPHALQRMHLQKLITSPCW